MRIVYIGLENRSNCVALCNEMAKLGHHVQAHVCPLGSYDAYKLLDLDEKLEIHDYTDSSELFNPSMFMGKYLTRITKFKPDILFGSHCHVSPLMQSLSQFIGKPYVIQLLDIPTWLMEKEPKRKAQWDGWWPVLKKAKTIIVNHEVAREELEKWSGIQIPPENVVIYGINTEIADMVPSQTKEDAVVSSARFVDFKANHLIPMALAYLRDKHNIILKYNAIGVGPELERVQELCKELSVETEFFPGVSDFEKWGIIKRSKILVYAQMTEHIGGLPPYEAMYAEIPALVSDYRILRDLYEDNVTYFNGGDHKDMATKLNLLNYSVDNEVFKWNRLNSAAKEYTARVASFETMAKGIANVLGKI